MVVIGVLLLTASIIAFSTSLGLASLPDKAVRARLQAAQGSITATGQRLRQVDVPRGMAHHLVSAAMLARLRRNLMLAGHPAGWTIQNIVLTKILMPAALGTFAAQFLLFTGRPMMTIVGVVAIVLGYFVPDLLVSSRAKERQEEMQRSLPDVLDKIVISIEAGLGFESALRRTAEAGDGPLADELVRTLQDIRLGMPRREAYESLQGRTTSADIISFIRGVMQAEEHGSSMSALVRIQAREMRVKRRLRAEAKAGRVSVLLLAPLMTCIFPVLFIVVLGPAVIKIAGVF